LMNEGPRQNQVVLPGTFSFNQSLAWVSGGCRPAAQVSDAHPSCAYSIPCRLSAVCCLRIRGPGKGRTATRQPCVAQPGTSGPPGRFAWGWIGVYCFSSCPAWCGGRKSRVSVAGFAGCLVCSGGCSWSFGGAGGCGAWVCFLEADRVSLKSCFGADRHGLLVGSGVLAGCGCCLRTQ